MDQDDDELLGNCESGTHLGRSEVPRPQTTVGESYVARFGDVAPVTDLRVGVRVVPLG